MCIRSGSGLCFKNCNKKNQYPPFFIILQTNPSMIPGHTAAQKNIQKIPVSDICSFSVNRDKSWHNESGKAAKLPFFHARFPFRINASAVTILLPVLLTSESSSRLLCLSLCSRHKTANLQGKTAMHIRNKIRSGNNALSGWLRVDHRAAIPLCSQKSLFQHYYFCPLPDFP